MPPDDLQRGILRAIAANRSPTSVLAGGMALQFRGIRLSNDIDLFHADQGATAGYVRRDIETLERHGYACTLEKRYPSFVEARVGNAAAGATRVQWTLASNSLFFQPSQDQEVGWRLHVADLATN